MLLLKMFYCNCFILCLLILPTFATYAKEEKLVLVHALFRHGDRTIDASTTFPTDPHINETYYPYGIGQLTNPGKLREFALGEYMRQKYNDLLGPIYLPELVDAVSTEMNRTKASLALVLAGLFPPQGTELNWNPRLNWQPIPFNYLLFNQNSYLTIPSYYCSNYVKLYWEYWDSPEGILIKQKYEELFKYLAKNSGLTVTTTMDVWKLYSGLLSEEEWNFSLPQWATLVYPELMKYASEEELYVNTATTRMKQLSGGFLLKKIIADTQAKIDNKLHPLRKMFLYSAHDLNVAILLRTLEVHFPHLPPYGACIFIEVYKKQEEYGIRIFYQDYTQPEPKALKVPGCDLYCPFKTFVKLLKKNTPANEDACGNDLQAFGRFLDMRKYYSNE